jgi:hypothetical protein
MVLRDFKLELQFLAAKNGAETPDPCPLDLGLRIATRLGSKTRERRLSADWFGSTHSLTQSKRILDLANSKVKPISVPAELRIWS